MDNQQPGIRRLIQRLDQDTALSDVEAICAAVKATLVQEIVDTNLELPAEFLAPVPGDYARRLLHRHPDDRYAVVVMTWGCGQGTPIHDHAGKWCVECVYQGRILVQSYELLEDPEDREVVGFRKAKETHAGRGAAGSLIPPFDHHVIQNTDSDTAVTVHVYGGEMDGCEIFSPVEGDRYRRVWQQLSYT